MSFLPTPLHPLIVHLPIAMTVLVPLFGFGALIAIRRGARVLPVWGLATAMIALTLGSGLLAKETGEDEEDAVENVVPEEAIETHEDAADAFVLAEPNNGGWGASIDADGESALIATTDGDTYNFPVEVVEARFPLRVERYELNCAAGGGAGRRRGGFGLVREYRVLDDNGAVAYGSMTGARRRPWGLRGGGDGTANYFEFCEDGAAPTRAGRVRRRDLQPGQLVRIVTGTGGGYGYPFDREPDLVAGDVIDGYITVDQAETEYGVVVDPVTHTLDPRATSAMRAARR